MRSFLVFVLVTLFCAMWAEALIPSPCLSNYSLSNPGKCCPEVEVGGQSIGPCGSNAGRGECVPVSQLCNTAYSETAVFQKQDPLCQNLTDQRLNWPSKLFSNVCSCAEQYGDFDCGRCAYGYKKSGNECVISEPLPRRSVTSLSPQEWEEYVQLLRKAKDTVSPRYEVLVDDESEETKKITVYDLFIWLHHYSTKDHLDHYKKEHSACDYAHESTGFLTWHRILLLWLERELQILSENPDFRISYWDWTNPPERTKVLDLFSAEVTEKYTNSSSWNTICLQRCNVICDPDDQSTTPLRRCTNEYYCQETYHGWPSRDDIKDALANFDSFDGTTEHNKYAKNSFSNFVEGFQTNDGSAEAAFCITDKRQCRGIVRKLHNTVHIILGVCHKQECLDCKENEQVENLCDPADGAMGDVRASPNDPIFIHHHAMIDHIFEMWLQEYPNALYGGPPTNSRFPGHSATDCAVPFIPVYTHSQVFKRGENFGYYYTDLQAPEDSSTTTATTTGSNSIMMSLSLITAGVMLTLIILLP